MTMLELRRIEGRIAKTICSTWRSDDNGNMTETIEGRISADDFMMLIAEIERLKKLIPSK